MTTFTVLGKSIPRIEGPEKVTGQARFVADIQLPGLLWAKILRSPYPHARIVRVDCSKALAMPGVVAAVSGKDVPGVRIGKTIRDMPILCDEVVRFVGDPVAAVAAETPELAEAALLAIEVEYQELPAVFDLDVAMQPDAPLVHPDYASYQGAVETPDVRNISSRTLSGKGDVEQGFAESDRIFEHSFGLHRVHQAYIEPRGCLAQVDADGSIRLWSSCKVPYELRDQMAALFGLSKEQVVVVPCNIGGDFGGKNFIGPEAIAIWLAQRAKRPVKIVQSYVEEFQAGNPRHGGRIRVKTGVKEDGTIVAREVIVTFNGGAYSAHRAAPGLGMPSTVKAPGPYRMPHARVETSWIYTNTVPGGIMRAPSQPQMMFATEQQLNIIAHELGLDPLELRLKNALREGDTWPNGDKFIGVNAIETLEKVRQASGWDSPLGPNRGRGLAMTDRPINAAPSGLTLSIDDDGTLTAVSGIPDVGTGAFTVLKAVLAEQLQVPFEKVRVVNGDTNTALFDAGIGGSKTTYSSNHSATETTTALKARLSEAAAERLECAPDDVELVDGEFRVRGLPGGEGLPILQLGAEVARAAGGRLTFEAPGPKQRPPQACFVANVVEVEVDPETGQVTPRQITAAHDVGFIINPQLLQAQVDGGTIQALGFAMMEDFSVNEDGSPRVVSFNDYKIPNSADVPEFVSVFVEAEPGPGPFGAKAVGELSLTVLGPAFAGAVLSAVGVPILDGPVTAERVYRGLQQRRS